MTKRRVEVAPCGVFCGACPSFNETCFGCSSDLRSQKRKSKWNCKIRTCCYEKKEISYCAYCDDFPCSILNKKIIQSHPFDIRFRYRHEVVDDAKVILSSGIDALVQRKEIDYNCSLCGGLVYFYHYKCSKCGKQQFPKVCG